MIRKLFFLFFVLCFSVRVYALDTISAKSYVLLEETTGRVVFSKNKDVKMKPASTTKILTAICAIENADLTDVVTISKNAAYQEGSSVYLKPGDKMSLENLVFAIMLNSGNDAAVAIAEHISGNVKEFSNVMNNKAKDIGARNSNFENPNGLDDDSHYVTAHDLGLITCYAMKNKFFRDVVKTNSKIISTLEGEDKFLSNHNKMLYMYDGCVGVKTGFTKKSGRTLVTAAKRGNIGLVAVTLNAPDDWNDHKKLLDKGFEDVTEKKIIDNTVTVDNITVFKGVKKTVGVRCAEGYYGIQIKNQELPYNVVYKYDKLKAPVNNMDKAGKAFVYLGKEKVFETDLVTIDSVEKEKKISVLEFIKRIFGL